MGGGEGEEVEAGGEVGSGEGVAAGGKLAGHDHFALRAAEGEGVGAFGWGQLDGETLAGGVGTEGKMQRIGGGMDADGFFTAVFKTEAVGVGGDPVFGGDGEDEGVALGSDSNGGVGGFGLIGEGGAEAFGGSAAAEGVLEAALVEIGNGGAVDGNIDEPGAVDQLHVVNGEGVVGTAGTWGGVGGHRDQHVGGVGAAARDKGDFDQLPLGLGGGGGGAGKLGLGHCRIEVGCGLVVGVAEVIVAVEGGGDGGLGGGIGRIEGHPHIQGVGGGSEGEREVGLRTLGVVVVVGRGGREAAGMNAASGHVAVGHDADDGGGVDGEVALAGGAGAATLAVVVVGG